MAGMRPSAVNLSGGRVMARGGEKEKARRFERESSGESSARRWRRPGCAEKRSPWARLELPPMLGEIHAVRINRPQSPRNDFFEKEALKTQTIVYIGTQLAKVVSSLC